MRFGFFGVFGGFFWGGGVVLGFFLCFALLVLNIKKNQGTEYTKEHQNTLVSGQEAFREIQAAEECIDFSFPIFITQ